MILAPSILSADFAALGEDIARAEAGGAGVVHVDVMDGHFVPNITIGPPVVRAIRRATRLPLDTHLMIEEPDRYLQDFREAGADWISVHWEACRHAQRTLSRIRELGARAGIVLNPATPLVVLEDLLDDIDYVLIMSVNPGFGGQRFLPRSLDRIARLRTMLDKAGAQARIEVDGGIGADNVVDVVRAGADIVVAGSAVFSSPEGPERAARRLLERAGGA